MPADVTGAWAGEIGQMQMLPSDYYTKGIDGDGDGKITLTDFSEWMMRTYTSFLKDPSLVQDSMKNVKAHEIVYNQ